MPRHLAALLATALILPAAAPLAQESEGPPALRDCRALLKLARSELLRTPQTEIEDLHGGCRFTHIGFLASTALRFDVDEMILLSPGLLAEFPKNQALVAADLTLNGFALATDPTRKLDLQLVYTTDPDASTAALDRFAIDAGDLGRFSLSASFSEFDNQDFDAMLFAEGAGRVHEVKFELVDAGITARLMGPLFAGPEKAATQQKVALSDLIRSLPETMISMVSAESIVRFVTALPEPTGQWSMQFDSAEGLPLVALNSATALEFMSLLPADARITATAEHRP